MKTIYLVHYILLLSPMLIGKNINNISSLTCFSIYTATTMLLVYGDIMVWMYHSTCHSKVFALLFF